MDNVINLEDKKQDTQTERRIDPIGEKLDSSDENSVEMIKRGIKGGLSILEKQISLWDNLDYENNSEVEDLAYRSLKGVKNTLSNLNQLVDMIQHDTVGVIQNLENQMIGQWTSQAHLQTLIETLKKNDLITEKQLEQTWNEIVPKPEKEN